MRLRTATKHKRRKTLTIVMFAMFACMQGAPMAEAKSSPRVVSMHHCLDQYVMDLADPEQIVSLSNVSQSPAISFKAAYAKSHNFGRNRGTAEEILPLRPDVVFAGMYWREAQKLLSNFGVNVVRIYAPKNLDDLKKQIRKVASLVDQKQRGENLVQRIEYEVQLNSEAGVGVKPRAGLFYSGGYTQGNGTYFNDLMENSSFQNVAAEAGMQGFGHISLEKLVTIKPDLIFIDKDSRKRADRIASSFMSHPALVRSVPNMQRHHLPTKYWVCGGEATITALKMLRNAHQLNEGNIQ